MAISEAKSKLLHWNYFLALESDLATLSRYLHFTTDNFDSYSTEMAHLLLAASSEVDVVLRQYCAKVVPSAHADNIEEYRNALRAKPSDLEQIQVAMSLHYLEFTPWENWQRNQTPDWWTAYNKVKHHRGEHFDSANLKNTLNAVGALFALLVVYYRDTTDYTSLIPAPAMFSVSRELIRRSHTLGGETGLFFERVPLA